MDFEHRQESLLPRPLFLRRMARWSLVAGIVLVGSLALGVCGYHFIEGLPWIDAMLNASMILGGMGPVDPLRSTGGKLFASFYALYSGLAIISIAGLLLAPLVHRFLHKFHLEGRAAEAAPKRPRGGTRS
ncbi:MAG TPA: hypothetical protein VNE82_23375 [Candidatus Binataceae bacterium]|nr:hypothetical protein [Candidatus Binataceae bacterium]